MIEKVLEGRGKIIAEIRASAEPKFLLGDFPVVMGDEDATLNIIFGDAGVGKSLLNQCLIHSLLEYSDEYVVLWFDLEYQSSIAKQRGVDYLLERFSNFYLLKVDEEMVRAFTSEYRKEFTNARFVYALTKEFGERFKDKRIVVFVDSLEDMIDDTSSDAEVKRIFSEFLNLKRTTFIFSHHINKKETANSLKFRGSMVIKAKLSSLLYIEKKEDVNDLEAEYSIDIVKMRALWNGNRKILVTINKEEMKLQEVNKNLHSFERKVLRSAYFLLRKHKEMKKTELIEAIAKRVKANPKSVREVLDKNADLFYISVQSHNKQIYSINLKRLDEFCVAIGIDNDLPDAKKDLIGLLDLVDDNTQFRVALSDNTIILYTKKSILNNIYKLTEEEVKQITDQILNSHSTNQDYNLSELIDF